MSRKTVLTRNSPDEAKEEFIPDSSFWEHYEKEIETGSGKTRLRRRLLAIEWFRCESLKRAIQPIYQALVSEIEKIPGLLGEGASDRQIQKIQEEMKKTIDTRFKEFKEILRGEHHWLVERGPRPEGWVFPYLLPSFRKEGAARTVKTPMVSSPERLVVTLDPRETNKNISECLERILTEHRKKTFGKERAIGGGRAPSLLRLWRALQAHDERAAGVGLKFLPLLPSQRVTEQKGKVLLVLAEKMLHTAYREPTQWLDRFL